MRDCDARQNSLKANSKSFDGGTYVMTLCDMDFVNMLGAAVKKND